MRAVKKGGGVVENVNLNLRTGFLQGTDSGESGFSRLYFKVDVSA